VLLKDQAYSALKDRIIGGQDPPGSFLSERKLVEQLSMSKTPIRAALERLESEGFVNVSPQQGIIIREPSLPEIADQFEIRFVLESYVLRRISGRLENDQIRQIQENLKAQEQAAESKDLESAIQLDGDFHLLLCSFQGNREIQKVMRRLREKIFWVIRMVFQQGTPNRIQPNWMEHQGIAEAVFNGEEERAISLLSRHFEYGKKLLLR
jgi:DNA-binding GntR family transcriptional regulator